MTHSKQHFNSGAREPRWRTRTVVWALAASCALVLVTSCGSDSNPANPVSPTSPPPPPPPPTTRVLQQGNVALAAPTDDAVYVALTSITDSAAGRWEATVDWGSSANELWMWVTDGVCTIEQFNGPECPFEAACPCRFAIRSEAAMPKPRVLTIPGASGGTRTLILANLGPGQETAQYRVTLTSSSITPGHDARTAAASSAPAVPAARKTGLRRP